MWTNFLIHSLEKLFKSNLNLSHRIRLTNLVLSGLKAVPLSAIIDTNAEGILLVNGIPVEPRQLIDLRESARGLLNNHARKVFHDQVLYLALINGANKAQNPEDLLFYKAAVWYGQKEDELLKALAGPERELAP